MAGGVLGRWAASKKVGRDAVQIAVKLQVLAMVAWQLQQCGSENCCCCSVLQCMKLQ